MAGTGHDESQIDPSLQLSHLSLDETAQTGNNAVNYNNYAGYGNDPSPASWPPQVAAFTSPAAYANDNYVPDATEQQDQVDYGYEEPEQGGPLAGPSSSNSKYANKKYKCSMCLKGYDRKCDLKKHQNNHLKPHVCKICRDQGKDPEDYHVGAEKKDLHRHMWTHHKETARAEGIPREEKTCPASGCGYKGRKDNVERHRKNMGH
ncbi:hypothetical protein B0H66DRAFT_383618 [Apodospora peruviana]|uniref:C2H2-type domain-containing protein n=1 Tax=Apodospora peruviana TaxID=516989 RepID=A0AAE0HU52_9PEZI|nr:hypothetical protein B0H66DRAFT_383618 [Apodospora peruviana]